jgi:hypothetical protein
MSDEKFKLPSSSYDELVKFIKAYSHVTKPTELNEISKLTGVTAQNISSNVGFFIATSILEGGKKKMATAVGQQLGHALEHGMIDEIRKSWRRVIEEDEFLNKLLTSVRIRNGMDSQTLEAHIAYSAGQPKKPKIMTGARTIIDILKAAELIIEVEGKYLIKDPNEVPETRTETTIQNKVTKQTQTSSQKIVTPPASSISQTQQGIQINIQVNINCVPDDIPRLGNQIKSMIQDIVNGEEIDKDGDE